MEAQIRDAKIQDFKIVGDLFAELLRQQFSMDKYSRINSAFDPHWFIEAMMNPPINHILLAAVDGKEVGFARLGILYGDGLIPLETRVRRSESSYLKRVPMIILIKLRDLVNSWIYRLEKRRSIAQILLPIKRGYIADFYILPEFRRKGIGRSLYKASIEWFASKGLLMAEMQYLATNEEGKIFWKEMGFDDYRVTARQIFHERRKTEDRR
jgi:GNAT superfamily N-acetyltransferase